MREEAQRLRAALVAAYRPWIEERLARLGCPVDDALDAAMADGERWLEEALGDLLGRPFEAQARGPLEIFQEAMRFPTAVLEAMGAEPVGRDEVARAALPGDHYDLAPASSSQLGEHAWQAHLAWGAAKADAFRR